ncbi:hypothetical protein ACIQGZ_10870 [Streptomyces sp. NPDC092296]|uniref:hypothetical protein n=1 Tax=Streptomyces sp. NPDC092296 TaxID=3366012 RepID=UPI0038067DB1
MVVPQPVPAPAPVRPPAAEAVALGLPVDRDTAADTVLDGADLGSLCVRAVSQRGPRNRADHRHRRDAYLLHTFKEFPQPVLLSAVAAGNPVGSRSQEGALLACRSLATHLGALAAPLAAAVGDGSAAAPDPELTGSLVRTALRGAAGNLDRLATRYQVGSGDVAVQLTALLSPLGDLRHRRHLLISVGSGGLRIRRDGAGGAWEDDGGPTAPAWSAATALPGALTGDAPAVRWRILETGPRDVLALGTGATLRLFTGSGSALATAWHPEVPGLHRYLHDIAAAPGAADRTLVTLWDTTPG